MKSQVAEMKSGGLVGLNSELENLGSQTDKTTARIEAEIQDIQRKTSTRFIALETKHSSKMFIFVIGIKNCLSAF